jgi:hypothetical protein
VATVTYPLSFGPALRCYHNADFPSHRAMHAIYDPLLYVMHQLPDGIQEAFRDYKSWWW